MSRKHLKFLLYGLIITACHPYDRGKATDRFPDDLIGSLTITGAYALTPRIQACADSFIQVYPHVDITITPLGSELALKHLAHGKCNLAMVSRPITRSEDQVMFAVPVAKTGVVMAFNADNPYRDLILQHGLTIQDLQRIYAGNPDYMWDEFVGRKGDVRLNPYTRIDPCGTAEVMAGFLYLTQNELKGMPVEGEYLMIEAIRQDPLALGYCNINDAFDLRSGELYPGLALLPVDLNMNGSIEPREAICTNLDDFQNSICNNTYPFKLSRDLSLVSLSAPVDELGKAFFHFILTDGQALVKKLGYSELSPSIIKYNLYRMKEN